LGATIKIYTAGPFGFSEAGRAFHETHIVAELQRLGHDVLDPWRLTDSTKITAVMSLPYGQERRDQWSRLNMEIGRANAAAIDACNFVFAVLDGVDVDSGTAAEIGYAYACGKPILGYRGDFRLSADNEGSIVNLQVEYFIRSSGGEVIHTISELAEALARLGTDLR
jgi:nucleoside 2-deoxyribosyltransferase